MQYYKVWMILPWVILFFFCAGAKKLEETEVHNFLASSAGFYIQKGSFALTEGRYQDALNLFRQAVALTPNDPVVQNNLGVSFFYLGQLDSALNAYQSAIRLSPNYVRAYINLSKAYLTLDDYPSAHFAARQVLQYQPLEAQGYILQAEIFEKEGDLNSAIRANQAALDITPDDNDVRNNLGALYFRSNKVEQAIQEYQRILADDSTHAIVYFNLGNALARKCLLYDAMKQYERTLSIRPDLTSARNNLGLVLLFLGNSKEAVKNFRRALSIDDRAAMVLYNLSIALGQTDSLQSALVNIERAIEASPTVANFYLQKGNLLEQLGEKDNAIEAYHRALALDSTLASGYNGLANALADDNPDGAISAYQKALSFYPEYLDRKQFGKNRDFERGFIDLLASCKEVVQLSTDYAMIHNNLGKVYIHLNQYEDAAGAFQKAIDFQSQLWEPYENLAVVYFAQKKNAAGRKMLAKARLNRAKAAIDADSLAAAEAFCQEAIRFYTNNPEAYAVLATIYTKKNMMPAAEMALRKGLSIGTNDYFIHYAYGKFLFMQGRHKQAETSLKRALNLNPRSQEARRQLADVLLAQGQQEQAYVQLAENHVVLGYDLFYAGFWQRALEEYQAATNLTANNADYLAAQGLIYAKKNMQGEADSLLRLSLSKDPRNQKALHGLGVLMGDRKLYREAIEYLQKALNFNPDDGEVHYALALNYHFLGQNEEAKKHAERAKLLGVNIKENFIDRLK